MSEFKQILKYIYEEQKIEEIYEKLGCQNIKFEQNDKLISAALPDGDNSRSVQTYCDDENLVSFIRTRGIKGNIFNVIGYIRHGCTTHEETKEKLYEIKKWIYVELGLKDLKLPEPKEDPLKWLKEIQKERQYYENKLNKVLPEDIMNQYIPYPHMRWIKEGISYETQILFGVGYDLFAERIVFAIHNKNGEIVGVKGRYVGGDKNTLDNIKYIYLYSCNKGWELFNLHRALPHIEEEKQVIVVEGEKSTMLLWEYGFKNCVAIGGSDLSEQQVKMLKDLGLDVEIVLAYDQDKDKDFIREQLKKFGCWKSTRKISVIFDKDNLLKPKMSPCDDEKLWKKLYGNYKYKLNK